MRFFLHVCLNLTSNELCQISLSCRALSQVAFLVLSHAIRLDYAYRDDRGLPQLNEIITKLKRRSGGFISEITIAHLSWPISSELGRRMQHLLSSLPNLQTLSLKEAFWISPRLLPPQQNSHSIRRKPLRCHPTITIRNHNTEPFYLRYSDLLHDILKLFSMKQLEHLSIDGFNYPMGTEPTYKIPSSRLESLAISTSARPTGRHVDLILTRAPRLKKFAWSFDFSSVMNQVDFERILSPAQVSITLFPLRKTLQELSIDMLAPTRFYNDGTGLELSGFEQLKVVKVHEEVLFAAYNEFGNVGFHTGVDKLLSERLPRSLERLEVAFDASCVDGTSRWEMGLNKLILGLVCNKKRHLAQLKHIEIIERDWDAYNEEVTGERVLEPPRQVQKAFHEAAITLKVSTRATKVWQN